MEDCIFCKIVKGEIPSQKVYEDSDVLAFLDIAPLAQGHTLVIPRTHVNNQYDASAELVAAVARRIPAVAQAVVKGVGAGGFAVVQLNNPAAGQEVPHLHFHIIPRSAGDGVSFNWRRIQYDEGQMEQVADAIRSAGG